MCIQLRSGLACWAPSTSQIPLLNKGGVSTVREQMNEANTVRWICPVDLLNVILIKMAGAKPGRQA